MYFFEIISIILLFLFVGAFFSPLIGGCFSILVILTILVGIVIFFSLNFLWFFAIGIAFYFIAFLKKYLKYRKLPIITEYLFKYPSCKLDEGVACYSCQSSKLVNRGLFYQTSKIRYYTCGICGTNLFRFRVL